MHTLSEDEEEETENVRISSFGQGQMNLEGLTQEELDKVQGAMIGVSWVRCVDGRLEFSPSYQPLPDPIEDPMMHPYWRKPVEGCQMSLKSFEFEKVDVDHTSPSITIQSLCGYQYSPANYVAQAKKLESYGFECLRSRRGEEGRYREIWHLPGFWAAQGDLKVTIEKVKGESARLNAALDLLGKVQFGTLDVSVQKMAMCMD